MSYSCVLTQFCFFMLATLQGKYLEIVLGNIVWWYQHGFICSILLYGGEHTSHIGMAALWIRIF